MYIRASDRSYSGNITTNDFAVYIGGNSEKAGEGYRSWYGWIDDVTGFDGEMALFLERACIFTGNLVL